MSPFPSCPSSKRGGKRGRWAKSPTTFGKPRGKGAKSQSSKSLGESPNEGTGGSSEKVRGCGGSPEGFLEQDVRSDTSDAGFLLGTVIQKITLHAFQTKLFQSEKRFLAAIAGVQGGKTTLGVVWLLQEAVRHPGEDLAIVAPTYKLLDQSTLVKWFQLVHPSFGTYAKQERVYTLRSGGKVFIRSAEEPESLEGMTLRAAWLDEAGQMAPVVWEKLQERTSLKQGRLLLTTTPYSLNWLYDQVYLRWVKGDPTLDVVQWRSVDSPYFPQAEYARAARSLRTETFEMRYGGEFRKLTGLVYPDFSPTMIVPPFPIPPSWEVKAGVDFGYQHPFVCLWIAKDPYGNVVVIDELYQSQLLLRDAARQILGKNRDHHARGFWGDPSAKQEIMELGSQGVGIVPAENNVDLGIQKVTSFLKLGRLKVFQTCRNLLEELEHYHWKPSADPDRAKDEPEKVKDHACDALRYVLMSETVDDAAPARPTLPYMSMGALLARAHRKAPRPLLEYHPWPCRPTVPRYA